MPKVSVIIPVYNVEKYLGECLDSVLGQTLRDIEVICVDDGSTDGSARILAQYAERDDRVRVIRQENAGPGPARNRALEAAVGECVAFMDPDDKYPDSGVLECLSSALASSGCAIAGGRAVCFPEGDPAAARRNARAEHSCAFPHLGAVEYRDYQVPFRYWCYMFRREHLDGIRFPDLRTFQDVPFFASAMAKAVRFFALDRIVYSYRMHEGNGTRKMDRSRVLARLRGIGMVMDIAQREGYGRLFDLMVATAWKNIIKYRVGFFRRILIFGVARTVFDLVDYVKMSAGGGVKRTLSVAVLYLANVLFRLRSISREVLFQTFQGEYCCNPKYASEALARSGSVSMVWALAPTADAFDIPMRTSVVRKGTLRYYLAVATAKVWFENGLNFVRSPYIRKRRGQVYFQPLHGSLGLKRQGLAGHEIRAKADAITDYCISNSAFETEVYRTSYWPTTEILEYGHPRNDVFFRSAAEKAEIAARVRRMLGVGDATRLALYAPTFRPDGDVSCLDLDPVALKEALERRFGGDWTILFRLHKRDAARHNAPSGSWVDASGVPDIQELMVACEVGVTDYSSWICDFVLGDGFGFIYARDVEKYAADPGFYYPLESTPFPVARSNEELAAAVAAFDEGKYRAAKAEFVRSKGCVDDGRASERCARKVEEVLGL